jgi:hypothetical protein
MGVYYGGRSSGYYDQFSADTGGQGPHVESERTVLTNGRFLHNLDGWSVAGGAIYSAGDGDDYYGVAVLPTGGGQISQRFAVDEYRAFTLHLSAKADGASATPGAVTAQIADGQGNAVGTWNLSAAADAWTAQTFQIGLAMGTTYTLTLTNVSHPSSIKLDDLWLWWLPITRAQIAARAHAKLSSLATSNSLSTTAAGALTEGDYTYAIDAGLRFIGAINGVTDQVDIRQLETRQINDLLIAVEQEMLDVIERGQTTIVDIKVGQREEKLSQISANITRMRKR